SVHPHDCRCVAQAAGLALDNEVPKGLSGGRDQGGALVPAARRIGGIELGQILEGGFQRTTVPPERGRGLLGDLILEDASRALAPEVGGRLAGNTQRHALLLSAAAGRPAPPPAALALTPPPPPPPPRPALLPAPL